MHQQQSISQNQQPSLPSQKLFNIQGLRFIQLKIRTSGEQNLILLVRVDTITGSLKNMVIDPNCQFSAISIFNQTIYMNTQSPTHDKYFIMPCIFPVEI